MQFTNNHVGSLQNSQSVEFTHSTSQVRAQVKFFLLFDSFLLYMSSGCYFRLHNDVRVAKRKKNRKKRKKER